VVGGGRGGGGHGGGDRIGRGYWSGRGRLCLRTRARLLRRP